MSSEHKVAVVQYPPLLLKRAETVARGVELMAEAAGAGARLISFPETWLPGYPEWVWRLQPGGDADYALAGQIHALLLENAVDLGTDDLQPILSAAGKLRVTVAIGIHERDGRYSRGTLYNTLVLIGPEGTVLNRHRKLMPTNPERMVWGQGDGSGLRVVDTPAGRVGGLICWENFMPLARYSLYAQGPELYVAPTWDQGDGWISTMRHIAQEGRCWVLGNGTAMRGADIPADFPERDRLFPNLEEWFNSGDSVIVAPSGEIVAGPLRDQHGILYADCDPLRARSARRTLDVAGHYARPDVFQLTVRRESLPPASFSDQD
jgi:nitrilase